MIAKIIRLELERIKKDMTLKEIASRSGLSYLTVWRKFNTKSPIDIEFIEVLENSGLIRPFDRISEVII